MKTHLLTEDLLDLGKVRELLGSWSSVSESQESRGWVCALPWEKGGQTDGPEGNCSGHTESMKYLLGIQARKKNCRRTSMHHRATVSLQPCITGLPDVDWVRCCNVLSDQMSCSAHLFSINLDRLNTMQEASVLSA